jgi:hypothetical protein
VSIGRLVFDARRWKATRPVSTARPAENKAVGVVTGRRDLRRAAQWTGASGGLRVTTVLRRRWRSLVARRRACSTSPRPAGSIRLRPEPAHLSDTASGLPFEGEPGDLDSPPGKRPQSIRTHRLRAHGASPRGGGPSCRFEGVSRRPPSARVRSGLNGVSLDGSPAAGSGGARDLLAFVALRSYGADARVAPRTLDEARTISFPGLVAQNCPLVRGGRHPLFFFFFRGATSPLGQGARVRGWARLGQAAPTGRGGALLRSGGAFRRLGDVSLDRPVAGAAVRCLTDTGHPAVGTNGSLARHSPSRSLRDAPMQGAGEETS